MGERAAGQEETGVLVDDADRVIGTAPRSHIRAQNLLHRGVAILVRNPAGAIYIHRRTTTKDVFPGMYDMVVGGMVAEGESYDESARRELAEEVGVRGVDPEFLFKHRYRGDRNNAWISFYQVVWPGPIRHQESEISWGAYMSEKEIASKLREWRFAPDHLEMFDRYRSWRAGGESGSSMGSVN